MKNLKIKSNNKGITLVSLVVTIIILIILASVSIGILLGENGLITKAKEAKRKQEIASIQEKIQLEALNAETEATLRGEGFEKAQLQDIAKKYGTISEDGNTLTTTKGGYELKITDIWYGVLSESGSYTDKVTQIGILEEEIKNLQQRYDEAEAKLPTLQESYNTLQTNYNNLNTEYTNFKKTIATAITNNGVQTSENATAETIATNVATLATNKYNAGYNTGLSSTVLSTGSNTSGSDNKTNYTNYLTAKNGFAVFCGNHDNNEFHIGYQLSSGSCTQVINTSSGDGETKLIIGVCTNGPVTVRAYATSDKSEDWIKAPSVKIYVW